MSRFVVSDPVVSASFGTKYIVILSDLSFWLAHWEELESWCKSNGCKTEGVTVNVPTDQLMTLFSLRWS